MDIKLPSLETAEQLKKRVVQLETQLADMTRQYETMIYTLSHDLRTPLMTILGFTDLLIADHAATTGENSTLQYLQNVRMAAARQAKLIEELLKLSRLTRCEIKAERLDLMSVAAAVLERLRASEPDRQVSIDVATSAPTVKADRELLFIALDALLGNAWKFTAKTPAARIELSFTTHEGGVTYTIADNGIGFDPKFSERLFQPFKRLHSDKEFAGLGTGLAVAATIIRRHGGKIWAESQPGNGSRFSFTLE